MRSTATALRRRPRSCRHVSNCVAERKAQNRYAQSQHSSVHRYELTHPYTMMRAAVAAAEAAPVSVLMMIGPNSQETELGRVPNCTVLRVMSTYHGALQQGCNDGNKILVICSGEGLVGRSECRRVARKDLVARVAGPSAPLDGKCTCCGHGRARYGMVSKGAFTCADGDVIARVAGVLTQGGKNAPLAFTVLYNDFEPLGADFEAALRTAMKCLQPDTVMRSWSYERSWLIERKSAWRRARRLREELVRGDHDDAATVLDHLLAERVAGVQPRVLAYGGTADSRQLLTDLMTAAGFKCVTVVAIPPLDTEPFDVCLELGELRQGGFEEIKADALTWVYLVHSMCSEEYQDCAGGVQWPHLKVEQLVCEAVTRGCFLSDGWKDLHTMESIRACLSRSVPALERPTEYSFKMAVIYVLGKRNVAFRQPRVVAAVLESFRERARSFAEVLHGPERATGATVLPRGAAPAGLQRLKKRKAEGDVPA